MVLHRSVEGLQDLIATSNVKKKATAVFFFPRKHPMLDHQIVFLVASNLDERVTLIPQLWGTCAWNSYSNHFRLTHWWTIPFKCIQIWNRSNYILLIPGRLVRVNILTVGDEATDAVCVGGAQIVCQVILHSDEKWEEKALWFLVAFKSKSMQVISVQNNSSISEWHIHQCHLSINK